MSFCGISFSFFQPPYGTSQWLATNPLRVRWVFQRETEIKYRKLFNLQVSFLQKLGICYFSFNNGL